MSITARDLFFVLRVRDEASGALNNVSRDLLRVGAAAQSASKRADAASARQMANNLRASNITTQQTTALRANARELEQRATLITRNADAETAAMRTEAASLRLLAKQKAAAGATGEEVTELNNRAKLLEAQARQIKATKQEEAAQLRAVASTKRVAATQLEAADETEAHAKALDAEAKRLDQEATKLDRNREKQQRLAKTISDIGKAATIAGIAMVGAGALGFAALLSTTNQAQEYQRQVALTQTQVDGFAASQKQLWDIGIKTANSIAAPFDQMQSTLYDIFSSTNANLSQGTVLLKAFSKAAVAGQVDIKDAADSTMGIMNAFKIPLDKVNDVLDVQFQLVRKGVGTYAQFSSVIGRAVPSAERYGASLQDLAGSLAFLTRNGLSPAMAAASAARAFDALDNPKAIENMKNFGVNAYDATGKLRPFTDVLQDLQKKLAALPKDQQLAALTNIFKGAGGTIQARRFLDQVLIGKNAPAQLKALIGYINDMKSSTGQFGSAYDKMSKTAASQTQLLKNKWATLKVTIGQTLLPVLITIVGWVNKLFSAFEKLSPSMQKIIIWGALIGAALSIVIGFFFIIFGVIASVVGAIAGLGISIAPIIAVGVALAGFVGELVGLGVAAVIAIKKSKPLQELVKNIKKGFEDAWTATKNFAKNIWNDFQTYVLPPLKDLWHTFQDKVMPQVLAFTNWVQQDLIKALKKAYAYLEPIIEKGFKYMGQVLETIVIPNIEKLVDLWKKHSDEIKKAGKLIGIAVAAMLIAFGLLVIIVGIGLVVAFATAVVIVEKLAAAFDFVTGALKKFNSWLINTIPGAKKFQNVLGELVNGYVKKINSIPGITKSLFKDAITWLVDAGKAIIHGLINGIKAAIPDLGSTLGSIGKYISDHKGPKSKDLVMLRPHGGWIMSGLMRGIKDSMPQLKATLNDVSNSINTTGAYNGARVPYAMSADLTARQKATQGPTKQITNHITVNTQEINPRKHAADLGWELANRM